MNAEDVTQKLNYIQQANGHTLNIEERAALQSSLLILKRNGKFANNTYGENLLKGKKTFTSHNGIEWVQLPEITGTNEATTRELCKQLRGRFMGDLSHEYFVDVVVTVEPSATGKPAKPSRKSNDAESEDESEEEEENKPDASSSGPQQKVVRKSVTEEKRLAHTIECIDHDTATVPRGALTLGADHIVRTNPVFEGLKGGHAAKLKSYVHVRTPVTAHKRSLLQKEGLSATLDFLDTLDEDIPKGCWALQEDKYSAQITLRNLLWPGFYFYHIPTTSNHGYVYFGFGEKNSDLGFML